MFKKIFLSLIPFALVMLLTSEQMSDDGRAGYTGSPGESDCTSCHSSFPVNTGGGSITFQNTGMPSNEYVPGQTYNMSVTVSRTTNNLFGFGFEALNTANDNAGTLVITDAAATQIKTRVVNSITRRNVVHQLNAGAVSGSKTFDFNWTAPVSGSGPVNFYFAGVACDGNGNDNNDYVYKSSLTVIEQTCLIPNQPSGISGNTFVCSGSNQNYSIPAVTGASSYTWSIPPGWTGTSASTTISLVAGNNSGIISVKANNACGSSTLSTLFLTATDILATISKTDVACFGGNNGSATLTASGGTDPYIYSWSTTPIQSGPVAINLVAGNYDVIVTDSNGCTKLSTISILQPIAPLIAQTGQQQTICEGEAIDIGGSPTASGGTQPYIYQWFPVNGLDNPTNANPLASPDSTTTYTLSVIDANGCQSSQSVIINVLPAPAIAITLQNDTLFASGNGPYQWYFNSTILYAETNVYLVPGLTGTYEVTTEYPNGCNVTSAPFLFAPLEVSGMSTYVNPIIFPNPANDHLNVIIPIELKKINFKIVNVHGQMILDSELHPGRNHLNLDFIQTGLYTIITENEKRIQISKLLILK